MRTLDRRAFLAGVATAIPLGLSHRELFAATHAPSAESGALAALAQEMRRTHAGMKNGVRAEHLRAMAMQSRLLAAHGRANGWDEMTKRAVAAHPSPVLVVPDSIQAELRQHYGDAPRLPASVTQPPKLQRAFANGGITGAWAGAARVFDKAAASFDRTHTITTVAFMPLAAMQQEDCNPDSWWDSWFGGCGSGGGGGDQGGGSGGGSGGGWIDPCIALNAALVAAVAAMVWASISGGDLEAATAAYMNAQAAVQDRGC